MIKIRFIITWVSLIDLHCPHLVKNITTQKHVFIEKNYIYLFYHLLKDKRTHYELLKRASQTRTKMTVKENRKFIASDKYLQRHGPRLVSMCAQTHKWEEGRRGEVTYTDSEVGQDTVKCTNVHRGQWLDVGVATRENV